MAGSDKGTGVRIRPTIDEAFNPRRNSLNFLRLVLALAVMLSHSITIGGFGSEVIVHKTTLGTIAVYGFFGISGFLIARSAARRHVGRYLWQRFLRIFPAFWVCLLVTAFGLGFVGWYHLNPVTAHRCGVSCYVNEPDGPWGYIVHNLRLRINQPDIAHTVRGTGILGVSNGSLWTLFYEFLCYLMLAVFSVVGLLRRRAVVASVAVAVWITEVVVTSVPRLNGMFDATHNWDLMNMLTFVPIFLVGSLLYLYREEIPDSGTLALSCVLLGLFGLGLPVGNSVPAFTFTSVNLTAVFFVYPLLWLGIHLPFHRIGARNDYSYGIYIYAFPVQQLLVVWGANRWGYWPYALVSMGAVAPLAVASWWIVERHALSLKEVNLFPRMPARAGRGP